MKMCKLEKCIKIFLPIALSACCSSKVKFSKGTSLEIGTTATVERLDTITDSPFAVDLEI